MGFDGRAGVDGGGYLHKPRHAWDAAAPWMSEFPEY